MSQLSVLLEEFTTKIEILSEVNDRELIEYLCGEIQHLINRVDLNRRLNVNEQSELRQRQNLRRIFAQFYAYMLVNDLV